MVEMIKKDVAQATLTFLNRVETKGEETDLIFYCKQWMLQEIAAANKPIEDDKSGE